MRRLILAFAALACAAAPAAAKFDSDKYKSAGTLQDRPKRPAVVCDGRFTMSRYISGWSATKRRLLRRRKCVRVKGTRYRLVRDPGGLSDFVVIRVGTAGGKDIEVWTSLRNLEYTDKWKRTLKARADKGNGTSRPKTAARPMAAKPAKAPPRKTAARPAAAEKDRTPPRKTGFKRAAFADMYKSAGAFHTRRGAPVVCRSRASLRRYSTATKAGARRLIKQYQCLIMPAGVPYRVAPGARRTKRFIEIQIRDNDGKAHSLWTYKTYLELTESRKLCMTTTDAAYLRKHCQGR